jgi:hypothetical protein
MSILTVTAKGQITLRKALLSHLGIRPGDRVSVEPLPGGRLDVRAATPTGKIQDLFGALSQPGGPSLTIEDMNRLIAEGWSGKA